MFKVDVSQLNKDLIKGIERLSNFYHFKIGKGGLLISSQKIENGYEITSDGKKCVIKHSEKVLFFTSFSYLLQYKNTAFSVKKSTIKRRGIMRDSARNAIMNVEGLKELSLFSAMMGYNYIEIYSEDLFDLKEYPYFGLNRGRYTKEEIKEMDEYCRDFGIELVPCVQTFAHLPHLFRYDYFDDVNDVADILLIEEEKTYKLIEELISFIEKSFTSKNINIGMDEAHMFGQGKYAERFGDSESRAKIFFKHLNKVVEICRLHGMKPAIWSDMVFKVAFNVHSLQAYTEMQGKELSEDFKALFPKDVRLIFWDYYNTDKNFYDTILAYHYMLTDDVVFAGGALTFSGFAPLNTVSEARLDSAIKSVIECGCNDFLLTNWGNGGGECHCLNAASTLLFVAERLSGNSDKNQLNERAKSIFGNTYEELKSIEIIDRTSLIDENKDVVKNPSKYLLYNDPLLGIMDAHVRAEMKSAYLENSKELKKIAYGTGKLKRYFNSIYKLSRCLEIKATLGIEIFNAYKSGNHKELYKIYKKTLPKCIKRLNEFFLSYRETYLSCNKSYGVEVVDIRFGAVKKRFEYTQEKIKGYLFGEIDRIEELEIKRFPPRSFDKMGEDVEYNSFIQSLSGGAL